MGFRDSLRVEILNSLQEFPTHAYDLWKNYNFMQSQKEASSFYRFLRQMVKDQLLDAKLDQKSPKSKGSSRHIYTITEKGRDFLQYYEQKLISQLMSMAFRDLHSQLVTAMLYLGQYRVQKMGYYIHTYFDARDTRFFNLIYPIIKSKKLDLIVMSFNEIPSTLSKRYPDIKFLGNFAKPNDSSIDWLFCPDAYLFLKEDARTKAPNKKFEDRIAEWKHILSPRGLFMVYDTFPEIRGYLSQFILHALNTMKDLVPPITVGEKRNEYRNLLRVQFFNITRFETFGLDILIGTPDSHISIKDSLKDIPIFKIIDE